MKQASSMAIKDPAPANDHLAPYVCRADETPFAVIERVLNNDVGLCLVLDEHGCPAGQITADSLRDAVRSGAWTKASTVAAQVTPCPAPVPRGSARNAPDNAHVLTPVVDERNRLVDVIVNQAAAFVPVAQPQLTGQEFRNLMDAFLSTWISSTGEYIRQFEAAFAQRMEMSEGIAASNGTVSLHLALLALGIEPGDEVIVPDLTFAATINAVLYCGATPVIADVDPETWCLSAEGFKAAITPRTRAVIPVHVFGRVAEMTEIAALAKAHKIAVVEDCAEAHGATYDGHPVGSFSDISSFSFFANKIITTGEGGMCLTRDPALAKSMRVLRDHGMSPERRYWHEQVGYNYRMTNMQASIGMAQLQRMDEILERNRRLAAAYRAALDGIPGVAMPPDLKPRAGGVTWFVCARVPAEKRAKLIEEAKKDNIDIRPFFHALSAMPAYAPWAQPSPVSRALSETGVNLPTSYRIDDHVIERVAGIFRRVLA